MIYIDCFTMASKKFEYETLSFKKNVYRSCYPFHLFSDKELSNINFNPITIFYGGNGSGKTTLLNIIANKANAGRKSIKKFSDLFDSYVDNCQINFKGKGYTEIKYIASDDVFDYLLNVRAINNGVNCTREALVAEYKELKYNPDNSKFDDYEYLKNKCATRTNTMSKYVRTRLGNNNFEEMSNGESALEFWQHEIQDNAIYLLDEPENSLSAENQIKLARFIEESTRFYNCQFIISTHSPFLLALDDALIYNLDEIPVNTVKWNELPNVLVYYNFFKEHKNKFED